MIARPYELPTARTPRAASIGRGAGVGGGVGTGSGLGVISSSVGKPLGRITAREPRLTLGDGVRIGVFGNAPLSNARLYMAAAILVPVLRNVADPWLPNAKRPDNTVASSAAQLTFMLAAPRFAAAVNDEGSPVCPTVDPTGTMFLPVAMPLIVSYLVTAVPMKS